MPGETDPIVLPFPLKGLHQQGPRQRQPDGTSPDLLNVMPFDATNRARGGVRPGTVRMWLAGAVDEDGNPVDPAGNGELTVPEPDDSTATLWISNPSWTNASSDVVSFPNPLSKVGDGHWMGTAPPDDKYIDITKQEDGTYLLSLVAPVAIGDTAYYGPSDTLAGPYGFNAELSNVDEDTGVTYPATQRVYAFEFPGIGGAP